MKKIVLLFVIISVFSLALNAQNIKVVYKESVKLDSINIQVDDPQLKEMIMSQLPEKGRNLCLYYNNGESIYKELQKKEEDPESNSFNQGMLFVFNSEDGSTIYKNQKENKLISQEYILDRKFLITDSLTPVEWELINEEKVISNYKCKKAVTDNDVIAWYCTDIPVNDGPLVFWGLPGLIMELEVPGMIISVEEIDMKDDFKNEITIPEEGKKITREKFEKLKTEKLGNRRGGEGTSISIEIHN